MRTKPYRLIFLLVLIFVFACGAVFGQNKKTIVLVRHVEKDASPNADKHDPELSVEGRERAQRLMQLVRKYKPREIFSTNFKRTLQTAEPIANRRKKQIQIYDPAKPAELIEKMMANNTDRYLIVGHSNTIPVLANLLAKKEIFRQMPETEFGVIWVIRMKKGVVTKVEILTY